jgi:hypothetical protein
MARLQAQESSGTNGDWATGFRIEPAFTRFSQRWLLVSRRLKPSRFSHRPIVRHHPKKIGIEIPRLAYAFSTEQYNGIMTIQNNVLSRIIARSPLRNTVPQYRSRLLYHRDLASPSVYCACGKPYPDIPGSRYFCYRSLRVRFSLDKLEDASMGDRGVLAGKRAEESPSGQ